MLFVGYRRRALDAARACGLQVVIVAEKFPAQGRSFEGIECSLEEDQTDWQALAALAAQGRQISAVLALTERSVVPAALLRRHLGLADASAAVVARNVTDKLAMKLAISGAGLPCATFTQVGTEVDGEQLIAELGLPLILKPRTGSGGRSKRLVRRRKDMPDRLPPGYLAEGFVAGTEMSFESLVRNGEPIFTNPTAYFRPGWASIVPATLAPGIMAAVEELNTRALRALGVRDGFTHLEVFLTPRGPVFGELAARPPGGHLTELIELAYGFDPWKAWLRLALGDSLELPQAARRTAGAWILHPRPGIVHSIAGLAAARAVPGVERLHLRVEPGTEVGDRLGTGQEVGHLLATGRDRAEVEECLRRAHRLVRFRMIETT